MGLLDKIFKSKNETSNRESSEIAEITAARNATVQTKQDFLAVHPDIRNYIWIADGKYKNYKPTPAKKIPISYQGLSLFISFGTEEEPSLIYMGLPIANVNGAVERPPYYPTYKGLTPAQRGVYWKLLANPYDNSIDIGYVFILYYGLERFLLTDKYEEVIDVILNLRDAHSNKSFQMYSANAIILTCLHRQRADIVQKFMGSLDKEYEFNFSPNLYLLCKYALRLPLTSGDVMRMAKAFEFTKNNYIKNYPDLFINTLSLNIAKDYKADGIPWSALLSEAAFKKLQKEEIPIFANISIREKTINVPTLLSAFKFKKAIYDLLDNTHEGVKKQLAEMKKRGEVAAKDKTMSASAKTKEALSFDSSYERELLNNYNNTKNYSLDQHFASISLQDFYYKYRNLDKVYLDKCIAYCKDDISKLPKIQTSYIEEEKKKINSYQWLTQKEKQKEMSDIKPFYANIPAFKRLAIIYEKEKDYDSAISICEQAISYYTTANMPMLANEFNERCHKIMNKRHT